MHFLSLWVYNQFDVEFLTETISEFDLVIMQLEIPLEVNRRVIDYAYTKGVPVMLNSAPYQPLDDELLSKLTYIHLTNMRHMV